MDKHLSAIARIGTLAFCFVSAIALGADTVSIHPGEANNIAFPKQEVRFVRLQITATNGGEPCIDEFEIYGEDPEDNLARASAGAKATASSCLSGHAIHRIPHLNDGQVGNGHSWIAAGTVDEWAQIEFPEITSINRVVFSRDRTGVYRDRTPIRFEIMLSVDGEEWKSVSKVRAPAPSSGGPSQIPIPPPPSKKGTDIPLLETTIRDEDSLLRYAFLGEEHAWLKTYGRADISPALVPYNGRVKEYPKHRGDDTISLPLLSSAPALDGNLDDECWERSSRGVVRVAHISDFDQSPCVEHILYAGRYGDNLFVALKVDRLLSSHLAVISNADGDSPGVIAYQDEKLVFLIFDGNGNEMESTPLAGGCNDDLDTYEIKLPLHLLPNNEHQGIRIGLGMGGKHTSPMGRPINLVPSNFAMGQIEDDPNGKFQIRLIASPTEGIQLKGNTVDLEGGFTLGPGESRILSIAPQEGAIGPEYDLHVQENGKEYSLHLFHYDPTQRSLDLMEAMIERLSSKGIDLQSERESMSAFRERRSRIRSLNLQNSREGRDFFFEVRRAKRNLFFKDPELSSMQKILFAKRRPFEPSHNYSVNLDARFRPGGGVHLLEIPLISGRLDPARAQVETLFEAGEGIARTPMASPDLSQIYFAYRPSEEGYYHIMVMDSDGGSLRKLTDGPFHDYWPCPLPDGGLAFITTRCKQRFLCWRPQAAVLFRMNADGTGIRPLSYANLTEWAPSLMSDGRIIWTRSEYQDKGADFGHTLWSIRPDGTKPELVFGNDIIQPNGYANGREVPGTNEFSCTLISHFGDLNGPIALVDIDKGRFNPEAITCLTPEVPWPGAPPKEECFRDPVPVAKDYFLCSHAPLKRFGIYVIDRFRNREVLHLDPNISSVCPTLFQHEDPQPLISDRVESASDNGEFFLTDVYEGIEHAVERGTVKYLRVVEEVRDELEQLSNGAYRNDHEPFMNFYVSPVDLVSGPAGWPTYVAKAPHGIVPVEEDGSARFYAPAGKVLYFEILNENFNEIQRMRSVVQLQPGEKRSCIGCHEHRQMAPPNLRKPLASGPRKLDTPTWAGKPFCYQEVVQPVLDKHCVSCHNAETEETLDLSGDKNEHGIPTSYRTLISEGWVNYCDCGWNSGGCEKLEPLTFGTVKSKVWDVLNEGHYEVKLATDEVRRFKTWIDMNCPLWPDYVDRTLRKHLGTQVSGLER